MTTSIHQLNTCNAHNISIAHGHLFRAAIAAQKLCPDCSSLEPGFDERIAELIGVAEKLRYDIEEFVSPGGRGERGARFPF